MTPLGAARDSGSDPTHPPLLRLHEDREDASACADAATQQWIRAEEFALQAAWAQAEEQAARDDIERRVAEDAMYAQALRDPAIAWHLNIRALMAIAGSVARARATGFIAFMAALRRILVGLLQNDLSYRLCRLAARRAIALAATPSGRAIPSHCLTPRLVAQRPQTARATRAVLMR